MFGFKNKKKKTVKYDCAIFDRYLGNSVPLQL